MRSLWRTAKWPLFGLLVIFTATLGYLGFDRYFRGQDEMRTWSDVLYVTMQLFVLESGSLAEAGAPWQLEVARLLAPATTGLALATALAAVFRHEIAELRLRQRRGHIVICGLGEKGALLATGFLDAGYDVVGIERDPAAGGEMLRRHGGLWVEGDARDPEVLSAARIERASHVVALTGSNDGNAEIAARTQMLAPATGHALTCWAHIDDPSLCRVLRSAELAAVRSESFRLEFFNIYELGARTLLRGSALQGADGPLRMAVLGMGPLGAALLVEAARQWHIGHDADHPPIEVTIFDGAEPMPGLYERYSQVESALDVTLETEPAEIVGGGSAWDVVFVLGPDPSRSLDTALQLRSRLKAPRLVADLTGAPGLSDLVDNASGYGDIETFDLYEQTLQPDLVLGGVYEVLARAIHGEYVAEQLRQGATAASNPAVVPWEQLPDALKESNRDQAAQIGFKLESIGCRIDALGDGQPEVIELDEAEVERLAVMEHDRWVAQRVRDGWKLGPKDVEKKMSPYLVGWEPLSDEVKEWDRRAVRGIPMFLARAGYQVTSAGED